MWETWWFHVAEMHSARRDARAADGRAEEDEKRGRIVEQTWMLSLLLSRQEGAPTGSKTGEGHVPEENYLSHRVKESPCTHCSMRKKA